MAAIFQRKYIWNKLYMMQWGIDLLIQALGFYDTVTTVIQLWHSQDKMAENSWFLHLLCYNIITFLLFLTLQKNSYFF